MRSEVTVSFAGTAPVRIDLDKVPPMPPDEARAWLDRQFTEMECEPLRPTGKVLAADKVVVIAEAAGPGKLNEKGWAHQFARAVAATLDKPVVHIDVAARAVSY